MRKLSVSLPHSCSFEPVLIAQLAFNQEFDPDVAVPEGFKTTVLLIRQLWMNFSHRVRLLAMSNWRNLKMYS